MIIVIHADMRALGYCNRGARSWFARNWTGLISSTKASRLNHCWPPVMPWPKPWSQLPETALVAIQLSPMNFK